MTHEDFTTKMVDNFGEVMQREDLELYMFCSRKFYGRMLQWATDKLVVMNSGKKKEFGVTVNKFFTAGPTIVPIVHDTFNRGGNVGKILVYDAEWLEYVYLRDRDLKPVKGIQPNDQDGYKDEIKGEVSISTADGGQSLFVGTNVLS